MAFFQNDFVQVARGYYSPELGRFISPDTVLDGLNRYAYCGNNPINYVDPTGHDIVTIWTGNGKCYTYHDGKGNGEGSHHSSNEGNKGDANKSTGSGDTTSPGGKSDPTDGSGVTGNDPQQPPPGQNDPSNTKPSDPPKVGPVDRGEGGSQDLRSMVQEIAWNNPSKPNTDPPPSNDRGYWSCGKVFIDSFYEWEIWIRPLQLPNGLSGVAAIHQNLMNATGNGKYYGTLTGGRHKLGITPLGALAARDAANHSKKGFSIVVSTRAHHLQIDVPDLGYINPRTGKGLSDQDIINKGILVVQGGLAPDSYSIDNITCYYDGKAYVPSYTMGPNREAPNTTAQANAGPWEGSPTYFLIQVIF